MVFKHHSILRNPDIAQMCFTRKYIEMLGTGTLRMINDCKVNGFKAPKWKEEEKSIKVIFGGLAHTSLNKGVSEGVKHLYFKELGEGVNEPINEVYKVLYNFPESNTSEIAQRINKGVSTTERYLKILKDKGLVIFLGSPRTGGYVLTKHLPKK